MRHSLFNLKEIQMTAEQLGSIAGVILSLAVAYIPKLSDWYDSLDTKGKARVMGVLLVVAAIGVFAAGCINTLVPCNVDGAKELVGVLIAALTANQATYLIAVRPFQK
jgi:multisubunit Na+/H+ antiporter MnhG subunit